MKLSIYRIELPLRHEFRISRGAIRTQQSILVELSHDGLSGLGEVTANSFYDHSLDALCQSLAGARRLVHLYSESPPDEVWKPMLEAVNGDYFAMSALDMAAHDWWSQSQGLPTWQVWGLEWKNVTHSSFTIGIDSIENMVKKLKEEPNWPTYKIKVGSDSDIERLRELRKVTPVPFRVDANGGWTLAQTLDYIPTLAALGVEFIEQPLASDASWKDKVALKEQSKLPLIADEDCQTLLDVAKCLEAYHGINVKICKCGGLSPALKMFREARKLHLKTMLGCMVESWIAISGAAQLMPMLDFADLDGAVLLSDQPVTGVTMRNGRFECPLEAGNGGRIDRSRLSKFQVAD